VLNIEKLTSLEGPARALDAGEVATDSQVAEPDHGGAPR
jgi:hypothetical protein